MPAQLAFVCVAALVRLATVTVQLTVPEAIAIPVGTLALSSTTSTVLGEGEREIPTATLALSGTTPSLDLPQRTIPVPVGSLALSGTAPRSVLGHVRQPGVVRVAVSGTTCPAPQIDKPSVTAGSAASRSPARHRPDWSTICAPPASAAWR